MDLLSGRHPRPRLHGPAPGETTACKSGDLTAALRNRLATVTLCLLAATSTLPLTAAVSTGQCRRDARSLLAELEYQGLGTTLGCATAVAREVCHVGAARGPCAEVIGCGRSISFEGKCTAVNERDSCCLVPLADPGCMGHICTARATGDCVQICGGGGLSGAAIAGIIIGAVLLGAVAAAAAGVCYCRRNRKRGAAPPEHEVPLGLVTGQPVPHPPLGIQPAPTQQHAYNYAAAAQGPQGQLPAVAPAACPSATPQQPLHPQILPPAHVHRWHPGHDIPPQPVVVEGQPAAPPPLPAQQYAHPPAGGPYAHVAAQPCETEQAATCGAPQADTVHAQSIASTTESTVPVTVSQAHGT